MGIRMNLMVGYGLDLTIFGGADRAALSFDRLEDKSLFATYKRDVIEFADREDELMEKLSFHESMNPPTEFYQMVRYDDEFGLADKLLLMPAGQHKNWKRYGNILDTFLYEAERKHDDPNWMEPDWISHPGTLYPYIGLMKANSKKPLGVEKYWQPCYRDRSGFEDAIAWAPWHLWFLIKHLGLWAESKTAEAFLSLRPTIYRYWS